MEVFYILLRAKWWLNSPLLLLFDMLPSLHRPNFLGKRRDDEFRSALRSFQWTGCSQLIRRQLDPELKIQSYTLVKFKNVVLLKCLMRLRIGAGVSVKISSSNPSASSNSSLSESISIVLLKRFLMFFRLFQKNVTYMFMFELPESLFRVSLALSSVKLCSNSMPVSASVIEFCNTTGHPNHLWYRTGISVTV